MSDPFRLPEPCIVGCSGGRTSGYLLRRVLDTYAGKLPDSIRVVFANTGKEREETLKFVERISLEWDVPVAWLEYRSLYPGHGYAVVNYATASRSGEPFDAMLDWKARYRREVKNKPPVLPNPVQRFSTGDLKVKTMMRWARKTWGVKPSGFHVALALRSDESHRVQAALDRDPEGGLPLFPLADAGVRSADVLAFWKQQSFDLGLRSYQGNCDLCYMKSRAAIERTMRDEPERAAWWIEKERQTGQRFRRDRPSYAGILHRVSQQGLLFDEPAELESVITCEGGYCSD